MNKQSSTYTVIYIIVLVVVVGAALAFTSLGLKDRQTDNANADKMRQILASVYIDPAKGQEAETFDKYIVKQFLVDENGSEVAGDAFSVQMDKQIKLPQAKRLLPVFECRLDDGQTKYIIPVYGAGLWGPIWGYLAFNSDGSTFYGACFAHQG